MNIAFITFAANSVWSLTHQPGHSSLCQVSTALCRARRRLPITGDTGRGRRKSLRGECRTDGVLVLLADVAEIYSTNPEEVNCSAESTWSRHPPKDRSVICGCVKSKTCWCSAA